MKKMKAMLALMLSIIMVAACMSTAFATGPEAESEPQSKTYYMEDGTKIVITIVPDVSRVGESSNFVTTRSKTHRYNLVARDGDYCRVEVKNRNYDDTSAEMSVNFQYKNASGKTVLTENDTVPFNGMYYVDIQGNNGAGLTGTAITTVAPDNTNSISYHYSVDQSWS